MFRRKLKALNYEHWDKVMESEPKQLRNLIVWVENQKIRHYKSEDRLLLNDTESDDWPQEFDKYCKDVGCPVGTIELERVEWLLSQAIRFEYENNRKIYQNILSKETDQAVVPTVTFTNPLDKLDFDSTEFKEGVSALAKLLSVQEHPDHLVTLEACSKLVRKQLSSTVMQNPNIFIPKEKAFPFLTLEFGPDLNDPLLNKALKILNLLHIQDLRDLQTRINEAIVSVQTITANPKTDTKMGKVGF